jgi:hypothetical protein
MTATLTDPRPTAPPLTRNRGIRERLAGLERPLLVAGGVGAPEQRTTTFLDRALGLKETS